MTGGLCGSCVPGATRCTRGQREHCADDGHWAADPCGGSAPHCEDGSCLECGEGTPLADEPFDCLRPVCNGGVVEHVADDGDVSDPVGDCRRVVCDRGVPIVDNDDEDIVDDRDPCTLERCVDGVLGHDTPADESAYCDLARGPSKANSCARNHRLEVHCWGAGSEGQLGIGTLGGGSSSEPVQP